MRRTLGVASAIVLVSAGLLFAMPLAATADTVVTSYSGVGGAGQRPSLALSADGSVLYSADGVADHVSVIDTTTGAVLATIPTPDAAASLALSPDGSRLYVGIAAGTAAVPDVLVVIDTATRSVVGAPIPLGGDGVSGIAVSSDGSTLYVPLGNAGRVDVIDTATRTVATIPNTASQPRIAVLSPDGTHLYVSHFNSVAPHWITVYDLTASPVTPVDISFSSAGVVDGMTISPDGTHVYFTQRNGAIGRFGTLDTTTNAITTLDGIGAGSRGVAVTPDGTRAYVTNQGDNTVAIIDLATNALVATTAVAGGPQDIVISPDGRFAYTSNSSPASVSKIAIDFAPTITTTTLPGGTVGDPYSATVNATGFPAPTFSATGALPPGLSIDPATGAITGTPTTAGSYTFTVAADNTVRGDPVSASQAYTVSVAALVPSAPLTLSAADDNGAASLTWSAPAADGGAAVTGYRIERSVDGAAFATLVTDTASAALTYTDTTVAPGHTYSYRVSAINSAGSSAPSNIADVTFAAVPPDAPGGTTAPSGGGDGVGALPSSAGLASTGTDVAAPLLVASLLVLAGAALHFVRRRRPTA